MPFFDLQISFRAISALFPHYFRAISALFPHYFRAISALFPRYFREFPRNFRDFREVAELPPKLLQIPEDF